MSNFKDSNSHIKKVKKQQAKFIQQYILFNLILNLILQNIIFQHVMNIKLISEVFYIIFIQSLHNLVYILHIGNLFFGQAPFLSALKPCVPRPPH